MKLAFVGMGSFLVYVSVKELLGGRVFLCADTIFNRVVVTLKIVKISLKIVKNGVLQHYKV